MKILIDADGCPVVSLTVQEAAAQKIPVVIFCDTAHQFNLNGVTVITVDKGADAVDFVLVNQVQKGDIVITQDYGLAAMVLSKGGRAISQDGMIYHNENIDGLLFSRHLSKKMRESGQRVKGPAKRRQNDDDRFMEQLRRMLAI